MRRGGEFVGRSWNTPTFVRCTQPSQPGDIVLDNMTICGYHKVMINRRDNLEVRIAEFKARMSEYLRGVRQGQSLVILDRRTPIAQILPYAGASAHIASRKPVRSPKDVRLPAPLRQRTDSLHALLEERGDR